jgi:hypothetical protein
MSRLWTDDEVDVLHDLITYNSHSAAARQFLEWQSQQPESPKAHWDLHQVKSKISHMRRKTPRLDGLSMRGWGKALGLGTRHLRLRRAYDKKYPKEGDRPRETGVSLASIKATLVEYPNILAECDLTPAQKLFGEEFVNSLKIPKTAYRVAIRNLDTGQVFDSIDAAAEHHFLAATSIFCAMKRNGTSGGFRWERIN